MKVKKVWPDLVIRRALLMVPFCVLVGALMDLATTFWADEFLQAMVLQENHVTAVTVVITFHFITQVFLALFYPFCLWGIRSLTPRFSLACRIVWAEAVSRLFQIALYIVFMGDVIATGLIPESAKMDLLTIYNWTGIFTDIMNCLVIFLLLDGMRTLLPGKENAAFRRIVGIFQCLWVLFNLFENLSTAGFHLYLLGPPPDWILALSNFYFTHRWLKPLMQGTTLFASLILLISSLKINKLLENSKGKSSTNIDS